MSKNPTDEQLAIINSTGNVAVNAKPGSGKTFTIVEKIARVLEPLKNHKGIIAISYTNKASDEILKRFKNKNISIKNSFFGTMHKFYLSEIIIPFSKYITGKTMEPNYIDKKDVSAYYEPLLQLTTHPSEVLERLLLEALSAGYIILDKAGEYACYILDKVNKAVEYLTARYTAIFIDEYQDCGEAQHCIFLKLISYGLDGIAVGDLDQAIYGYDNKQSKYLVALLGNDSFKSFDLSKNFRCHKTISDYSLALYKDPEIKEKIQDSRVYCICINGDETEIARLIDQNLPKIINKYSSTKTIKHNQIAILARNRHTAEMLDSHLQTPHKYFKPTLLDLSSDECDRIYKELLVVCFSKNKSAIDFAESFFAEEYENKKLKKLYNLTTSLQSIDNLKDNLINHIDSFCSIAKLILIDDKKVKTEKLKSVLSDKDTLDSFVDATDEQINIITMHGAKGLEFEIVFHLNLNNYELPSYDAITKGGNYLIQDINLHYVSITRAIEVCYLITNTYRTNAKGQVLESSCSSLLNLNNSLPYMRKSFVWK